MTLKLNLTALIGVFLFCLTLASMGTAHAAVLGISLLPSANTPSANTVPPTQDNLLDTRDQVSWAAMAEYADAIKGNCTTLKRTHGHYKPMVLGQAFDAGGWNVILGIEVGTIC